MGEYLTDTVGFQAAIMNNPLFVTVAFAILAFFIIMVFFALITGKLANGNKR